MERRIVRHGCLQVGFHISDGLPAGELRHGGVQAMQMITALIMNAPLHQNTAKWPQAGPHVAMLGGNSVGELPMLGI
jgi:hypothetical protein